MKLHMHFLFHQLIKKREREREREGISDELIQKKYTTITIFFPTNEGYIPTNFVEDDNPMNWNQALLTLK
jgi:hypothetical protein